MRDRRLGINKGCYHGERVDIGPVLSETVALARRQGWTVDELEKAGGSGLCALRLPVSNPRRKIYISAGIHGDEPAGPLAILQLMREHAWSDDVALWVCPCLNPAGFSANSRENANGVDLNRDYRNPQTAEVRAHTAWLERQPDFDLALCLHEDWEAGGFYLYELNLAHRESRAREIVQAVSEVCPIDEAGRIDGLPAKDGIISPEVDPTHRPDWPEAFYLIRHKTRLSYTLEAPSDYPLSMRVDALRAGVCAVLAAV